MNEETWSKERLAVELKDIEKAKIIYFWIAISALGASIVTFMFYWGQYLYHLNIVEDIASPFAMVVVPYLMLSIFLIILFVLLFYSYWKKRSKYSELKQKL